MSQKSWWVDFLDFWVKWDGCHLCHYQNLKQVLVESSIDISSSTSRMRRHPFSMFWWLKCLLILHRRFYITGSTSQDIYHWTCITGHVSQDIYTHVSTVASVCPEGFISEHLWTTPRRDSFRKQQKQFLTLKIKLN